ASSGQPCSRSTGSPSPWTSTWSSIPFDVTRIRSSWSVPRATARRPLSGGRRPDARGRARAQEGQVAGRVGAVDELVDRPGRRQLPDQRVGDRVAQRAGEAARAENLEGPAEEAVGTGVKRRGERQLVVQRRDGGERPGQVALTGRVGVGADR